MNAVIGRAWQVEYVVQMKSKHEDFENIDSLWSDEFLCGGLSYMAHVSGARLCPRIVVTWDPAWWAQTRAHLMIK